MKITYPGHANLLVEGHGVNFMCDPWLEGGYVNTCTVWLYPPRRIGIKDLPKLDFVWMSHEHDDHSNIPTIKAFPKDLPVYIMKFRNSTLVNKLKDHGMKDVRVLEPYKTHKINANTSITLYPSDEGWIDSAAVIEHDGVGIFHQNDCFLSPETLKKISQEHPIEIAFMPYAGFSGYPATYEFPEALKNEFAEGKKVRCMQDFFTGINALNPKYAVPAAGDLSLIGDEVAWVNYFDRCSPDDVLARAKREGLGERVLAMRAGDAYVPGKGFIPHPKRDEWKFTTEDILRFGQQPHVKSEIDKYMAWEKDVHPKNLQADLVAYLEAGLRDYAASAKEVGDYVFTLRTTGLYPAEATVDFKTMKVRAGFDENYTKKIVLDGAILYRVMRRDMLWCDAYSSCRMRLDRRPPTNYNRAFWRWLYNIDEMDFYGTRKAALASS